MLLYDGVIRLTCIYKGLNIFICFYVWLHSMQTKLTKQNNIKQYKQLVTHTKQSINIHAKAYKVIAMQSKA